MTEWITQDDWSTVKVGDQVRVTHESGDELKGYVDWVFNGLDEDVHRIQIEVPSLPESVEIRDSEWFLSVPAKPAVVIPTEPGVYCGSQFGPEVPFHLNEFGRWHTWSTEVHNPERHMPLVKLEPVAVTAKKVLDEVEAWAFGPALDGEPNEITDTLKRLRERFGVTDD